eukprot:166605-Chlamydomonas_euryale.AAC.1
MRENKSTGFGMKRTHRLGMKCGVERGVKNAHTLGMKCGAKAKHILGWNLVGSPLGGTWWDPRWMELGGIPVAWNMVGSPLGGTWWDPRWVEL